MKKIQFERYANKLQRMMIAELTEVQDTIENTLADFEINPFVTEREVADELQRIAEVYENFTGGITDLLIANALEGLSDDDNENAVEVLENLLQTYMLIEDIIFSLCTPIVRFRKTTLENLATLDEYDENPFKCTECLVEETDEDKDEGADDE